MKKRIVLCLLVLALLSVTGCAQKKDAEPLTVTLWHVYGGEMDFPAYDLKPVEVTDAMADAIGVRPVKAFMGRDLLCVLENEEQVRSFTPDGEKVKALDGLLLHTTAAGSGEFDCVSRSFAPKLNVAEDPVCGSGHCHIVPYWVGVKGSSEITAYQASRRGGTLYCRQEGERIKMSGKAVTYSVAEINF